MNIEQGQAILRDKLQSITHIPDEEWHRFYSDLTLKHVPKAEKFVAEGDLPSEIGFVIKGLIKKQITRQNGSVFIKDFSSEGEFVASYVAMLTQRPSMMDYIAIEDTELVTISFEKFRKYYEHHTCWVQLGRIVAEQMFILHEQRELELLLYTPLELYDRMKETMPHLTPRLKQAEIAAFLGITPESLSRLTKRRREISRKK